MVLSRTLGSILRGTATPLQNRMACILGGMLGFVPGFMLPGDLGGGFMQAPGLIVTFFLLVAVLNANLGVFGLVTLCAKLLSLIAVPISYSVGHVLLDGPTQGLFRWLINAPVTAWFGLEHYATSGGLLVGLVFGIVVGELLVRSIASFRHKMATLEESSPAYQKWSSKGWVRFLGWLVLGKGKGKKVTYQQLAEEQRMGRPVRLTGIAMLVLLGGTIWLLKEFFSEKYLTSTVKGGLESANGATVDLKKADVNFADGKVVLAGLAVADQKELGKNLFAADTLTASIDTKSLLKKRIVIAEILSRDATSGMARPSPGRIVAGKKAPPPPPPKEPDQKTIDDYMKDAQVWKDRLAQAQEWLDTITGGGKSEAPETGEDKKTREAREVAEHGYARVVAKHLIEGAPMVLVRRLALEGLIVADFEGDVLDIEALNLSTDPAKVEGAPRITVKSRKTDRIAFDAVLSAKTPTLSLGYKGAALDPVSKQLATVSGQPPLQGGTFDVAAKGGLRATSAGWELDLPLSVTLRNTALALAGVKNTPIDQLTLPIGVRGPLLSPRITFDDKALGDALLAAGKQELANQVRSRADQLLKGKIPGVGDALGDAISGSKPTSQVIDEAKKKAEDEIKKRAQDELKKRLPGGIPNPFGGKKG